MSTALDPTLQGTAQPPPAAVLRGAVPDLSGWDIENDALAHAMAWLTRHHGRERTPESLLSGLPLKGRLSADQALRAMREASFSAGMVQRRVAELHHLLLPAVLLLKEGDACIVVARHADDPLRYDIVMPGREHYACTASEDELEAEYTGTAIVCTPLAAPAQAQNSLLAREPGSHWLWGTLRRFMPYYRGAMLAALLSNVLVLVVGLFTSVVYDRVIPHQAFVTLWSLAAGAVLAVVFDLFARQLRSHLIDTAGKKADLMLGAILFRKALSIRLEHRPESAGSFAHHLAQLEVVREFSTSATMSAISDLPFIFLFIGMIWLVGGDLVLVMLVAVPLILLMTVGMQAVLRRSTMSANQRQQADMHGLLIETMEGMEAVRAASAQGHFQRQYEQANAAAAHSSLRARAVSAWVNNVTMVSQQLITVVMLVWGVHLIHEGQLTGGALISAVMFAGRAVAPLSGVVGLATRYQGARVALRHAGPA
jgi:ATP-binding cassette subfamily C protein LapB